MAELADRHCEPCEKGTPPLSMAQAERLAGRLTGWALEDVGGRLRLGKTFRFKGFMPGVGYVNQIADIAEAEQHHPDLLLSYGSLTVQLWTHAAGGLTDNDFILAARIDRALRG